MKNMRTAAVTVCVLILIAVNVSGILLRDAETFTAVIRLSEFDISEQAVISFLDSINTNEQVSLSPIPGIDNAFLFRGHAGKNGYVFVISERISCPKCSDMLCFIATDSLLNIISVLPAIPVVDMYRRFEAEEYRDYLELYTDKNLLNTDLRGIPTPLNPKKFGISVKNRMVSLQKTLRTNISFQSRNLLPAIIG